MTIRDYWMLSPDEQENIRRKHLEDTEADHQAFLHALFPAFKTFEEADEVYDLSDTQSSILSTSL